MRHRLARLHRVARPDVCRWLLAAAISLSAGQFSRAATVIVDCSVTNQTIEGFGANLNYWSWSDQELKPVVDGLIDGAGMTLFRVIMNNGWETTNDNDDSDVMDWDYYNALYSSPDFERLWGLIGYLNQKGITNGIILNFQGPAPDWMGGNTLTPGFEDEWAEMIVSLLLYARNTKHLQFNLVAPNNEPDLSSEGIHIPTAAQYVTSLHKLAEKLDAYALTDIRLIGPDRSESGTNWLPEIVEDPVVMARLAHFGLHSYADNGGGAWNVSHLLQSSAYPNRTFWMTEFNVWCDVCEYGNQHTNDWDYFLGTASYLLNYLDYGSSAGLVWEGYDSYYAHHNEWSFWGLYAVDDTNAVPKTYTRQKNFSTLAQISRFVRPGARMLETLGSTELLNVRSFFDDRLQQLTLVGVNNDPEPVDLALLLQSSAPVANLDFYYTTDSTNLCQSATVTVTDGTSLVTVPGNCIFTLTGSSQLLPLLHAQTSDGAITISWPMGATNYVLETSVSLESTDGWCAVTNAPRQNRQKFFITVLASRQQQFFRLRKP